MIEFLSIVFSREGDPKELVSDNGAQFTSLECNTFLAEQKSIHRISYVYYPHANEEIEHLNRSLKERERLQTAKLEGTAWISFTTDLLQAYRAN